MVSIEWRARRASPGPFSHPACAYRRKKGPEVPPLVPGACAVSPDRIQADLWIHPLARRHIEVKDCAVVGAQCQALTGRIHNVYCFVPLR